MLRAAEAAGIDIEIAGIAGEYRLDTGFPPRLEHPRFLQVAGKYVLVELSLHQQLMGTDEMMFDLQERGYDLILAHPERYPYLNIDGPRLEQLMNQGIYMQVNALSFGGFYGDTLYALVDKSKNAVLLCKVEHVLRGENVVLHPVVVHDEQFSPDVASCACFLQDNILQQFVG